MSSEQSIRIADAFARGKAFVPFVTAGDPDLETTERLVRAMADAGADLIELGIPFSDPTAEGPVIQGANIRSLAQGTTTDKVFELVRNVRGRGGVTVPIVFMTYANVVFSYPGGTQAFCERAAEAGVQGLILPDVPFEEREEFAAPAHSCGLELVSMIAPTSNDRIRTIARQAEGFVYCVSSLGVTGERSRITSDIGGMVRLVREVSDVPVAVGFGISTPEQAARMASIADGAIVGSAIVRIIAEHGRDSVEAVSEYVRAMKDAVRPRVQ
jgi:tryptophan synthase alpha chain